MGETTSAERRDKLLELARVWTIAALTEGNIAVPTASPEGYPLEPTQFADPWRRDPQRLRQQTTVVLRAGSAALIEC